jgi:hypothetical protein
MASVPVQIPEHFRRRCSISLARVHGRSAFCTMPHVFLVFVLDYRTNFLVSLQVFFFFALRILSSGAAMDSGECCALASSLSRLISFWYPTDHHHPAIPPSYHPIIPPSHLPTIPPSHQHRPFRRQRDWSYAGLQS